jgi:hypothetical protein
MKNLPEKIYLQIGENCPTDVDFKELEGISWSIDKIYENDLKYVLSKKINNRFLPKDVTLKDLRAIRNYFGEHDKTMFEHRAYTLLDNLIKHFEKGETIVEGNGVDWNIFQNLKSFEEREQSIWKTQSNLREIMLKVDLSKKERRELEFISNQERSRL